VNPLKIKIPSKNMREKSTNGNLSLCGRNISTINFRGKLHVSTFSHKIISGT
jgi:hypothetical protein